ncbi:thiamine-phosphate kinase [Rhodoferax sp.]|uniref:thiamine-phosphate kinase n=1 Tax=Rhodoferax sp. TaxID=50421 RepID=UPI0025FEBE8A|nr:thiamine-phosphate kinase [Rhodoferax sp.]
MGEFDLIARYFKRPPRHAAVGVGDDCALWQPTPGSQLAISCDMLVQGRHFFADVNPHSLGHKALAVNLSDLAACGAKPLAFTLALALPEVNEPWLADFARGLFELADAFDCELIGGDTTCGPLNICITVFGEVPVVNGRSLALLRSGAKAGDDLYVSGSLGDARLALSVRQGKLTVPVDVLTAARARLDWPAPRVALGLALRGIATAAIDISDGLIGDLGHILESSGVGARVRVDQVVKTIACCAQTTKPKNQAGADLVLEDWRALALCGGDDYELLFTAPPRHRAAVAAAALASQTPVHCIGHIEAGAGLRLVDDQGLALPDHYASFDHFA